MPASADIPVIILVRPQLGENIGKTARAMLNFGLSEMRLVAPRDGWPNPDAGPSAAGADDVLDRARVFDDIPAAIADLNHVWAATVRNRDMPKPVEAPRQAACRMRTLINADQRCGILFGPEKAGLTNDDVVLADTVWTAPVNPEFSSLNLAQAVCVAAYEWLLSGDGIESGAWDDSPPAPKSDLQGLFDHLEGELDARNYFRPPERKPSMVRSLRNMLQGAKLTAQQVQTLRGAIKALAKPPREGRD